MKFKPGRIHAIFLWNFIRELITSVGSRILLMLDIAGWIASLFPKFSLSPLLVLVSNVVILLAIGIYILCSRKHKIITKPEATLLEHTYFINALVISPDEKKLASCGGDNYAILWDIVNCNVMLRIPHNGWTANVAFSPDNKYLFSLTGKNGLLKICDCITMEPIDEIEQADDCASRGLAVYPAGHRVLISRKNGTIRSFDPFDARSNSHEIKVSDVELRRICISKTGLIATANIRGEIFMIRTNEKDDWLPEVIYQDENKEMVRDLVFDTEDSRLAFTDSGGFLRIMDLGDGEPISVKAHNGHAIAVAFSPNGEFIATGGQDNLICVWRIKGKALKKLFEIHGHTGDVACLVFDHNKRLYSASRDSSIKVWNLNGLY